jgi:GTP pyrophosphokinase
MDAYNIQDVLGELKKMPPQKDVDLITRACYFAFKAHEGQTRRSGEPYFSHVFETAKNLARYEMDATTIAAGFLHDVIEDTTITEEELEKEFGEEIVRLVKGVTKLGTVKYQGHVRHVESLRKFLMALAQDYRVLMIKLADRLHNLKTLQHVREDKQHRIALESIEVYAPLADRFGIGKLKSEIEDAAFPYAYPKESAEVEKILADRIDGLKKSMEDVYKELSEALQKSQLHVKKIDYRIKHRYSLWKKLKERNMNFDNIYDIVAIRVIVETVEECYATLGIIHSLWKPLPARIKDFIALPKLNGYQSLHTTIFTGNGGIVEIQIRTEEMHGRAEFGIASHYIYKEQSAKESANEKFQWVSEFKNLGKSETGTDDFLKHLKSDFFSDRIFVFTPAGDIIDLPEGSSTIDFAYAVHSDIGNKASGARVNGKFVSLDTVLHSSDIVHIETRKDGTPKSKWLDITKTTMAKKHIRAYIKEHEQESIFSRFIPKKFR